jgi:predicted outer membrane protein
MNKLKHSKYPFVIAGAALLFAGLASAQETPTRPQQPPTRQDPQDRARMPTPATGVADESADAILVTWLLVENENEIALARLALQRATNPEVKQFAQKMIDDHGQFVQKLQAGGATARVGADTRDGQRPNDATGRQPAEASGRPPSDATGRPAAEASTPRNATMPAHGGIDHQRMIRELGQKCLASTTKMLEEKQGAEFDRCFMGMQVGAHVKAVDTIEVFRNYASPSLRPTLEDGLKTVQAHLTHAKDLAKRTDTAATGDANRK